MEEDGITFSSWYLQMIEMNSLLFPAKKSNAKDHLDSVLDHILQAISQLPQAKTCFIRFACWCSEKMLNPTCTLYLYLSNEWLCHGHFPENVFNISEQLSWRVTLNGCSWRALLYNICILTNIIATSQFGEFPKLLYFSICYLVYTFFINLNEQTINKSSYLYCLKNLWRYNLLWVQICKRKICH